MFLFLVPRRRPFSVYYVRKLHPRESRIRLQLGTHHAAFTWWGPMEVDHQEKVVDDILPGAQSDCVCVRKVVRSWHKNACACVKRSLLCAVLRIWDAKNMEDESWYGLGVEIADRLDSVFENKMHTRLQNDQYVFIWYYITDHMSIIAPQITDRSTVCLTARSLK